LLDLWRPENIRSSRPYKGWIQEKRAGRGLGVLGSFDDGATAQGSPERQENGRGCRSKGKARKKKSKGGAPGAIEEEGVKGNNRKMASRTFALWGRQNPLIEGRLKRKNRKSEQMTHESRATTTPDIKRRNTEGWKRERTYLSKVRAVRASVWGPIKLKINIFCGPKQTRDLRLILWAGRGREPQKGSGRGTDSQEEESLDDRVGKRLPRRTTDQ